MWLFYIIIYAMAFLLTDFIFAPNPRPDCLRKVWTLCRHYVNLILFRRTPLPFKRAINSDLIEIAGTPEATTARAVLWNDGTCKAWLPLSQIEMAEDGKSVLVPEWLAQAKGLI